MSLLPKTEVDFANADYWNKFFSERGSKEFEWYGEYPELCGELHKYIKPKDNILVVGCGNSKLSSDLYDVGCRQITNIDISSVVIKQMRVTIQRDRPDMKFEEMDVFHLMFEPESFTVALDKGTLDGLISVEASKDTDRTIKLFAEVCKILKIGGRYIIISLLQEHVLRSILDYCTENGWMVRIVRCFDVERRHANETGDVSMPIFFVVCTKFKKMNNMESVLEVNLYVDGKMQRVKSKDEIMRMVGSLQQTIASIKSATDEIQVEYRKEGEENPRYSLHIVDGSSDQRKLTKYAGFIVPHGRETEWLFGNKDGRKYLRESSGFDRLAVICLHRNQTYGSLTDVQDELRQTVLQFAPPLMSSKGDGPQIPYLTLGDGVGHRETIFKTTSEISGEIHVEEVNIENEIYRRLVFMSNQSVIQSEVKLFKKNRKSKKLIDNNYVAASHTSYMSVAAGVLNKSDANIAVIGVGGGGLCLLLHKLFPKAVITGVDIDPVVIELAKNYFGLITSDRLKIIVEDGLKFLNGADKFDVVIFDVNSDVQGSDVSCPPPDFISEETLVRVKNIVAPSGMFVVNVVCRVKKTHDLIIQRFKKVFSHIVYYNLREDVNRIIFASDKGDLNTEQFCDKIKKAAESLNKNAKHTLKRSDSIIDLNHLMKEISI